MYFKKFKSKLFQTTILIAFSLAACNSSDTSTTAQTSATSSSDDNALLGAGSTFIYPLFSKMFSEYNKANGLKVNYQSIGSGGGILQLTNKTVDFGASDAPLNGKQDSGMSAPALHIPVTAGAVVISYNLPEVKDTLKMTPEILSDI